MMATDSGRWLRYYTQLARVHAVGEFLRQSRRGQAAEVINFAIGEKGEPCSLRTTRRDLAFLEMLGAIELVEGSSPARWRWIAQRPLLELPALSGKAGAP